MRVLLFLFFMQLWVFGATLEGIVTKIESYTQGSIAKSMATLIVIGIGIFMAKNHERLKEIWLVCVIIIAAIMLIVNARSVVSILF